MKRLLCRLFGHRFETVALVTDNLYRCRRVTECSRCGTERPEAPHA